MVRRFGVRCDKFPFTFVHSVFASCGQIVRELTCSEIPSRVEGHVVSRSLRLKKCTDAQGCLNAFVKGSQDAYKKCE
jgi:hypothetical protein